MKRILVIRIGRLGDTILATTVIEVLQQALGADIQLDFVVSPGASAFLLERDRRVTRVFAVAHRGIPWRIHRVKRELEKHSRRYPYDLVINLECGDECDDFIRFVHCREFLGRPQIQPAHRPDRHCVDTEKTIYAERLGYQATDAAEPSLQAGLDLPEPLLPADTDYLVLNPGFSGIQRPGYRSHRRWPRAHWQKLIELIDQRIGIPVLINGVTGEADYFASLLQYPGAHSLFGSSLATLAVSLRNARCLVTVDTGTMHMAAALGTPVVALFGPTNALLTGPYSKKVSHRVLQSGIDCQPCVNTPQQKTCRLNRCMTGLDPERVFEACREVLQH